MARGRNQPPKSVQKNKTNNAESQSQQQHQQLPQQQQQDNLDEITLPSRNSRNTRRSLSIINKEQNIKDKFKIEINRTEMSNVSNISIVSTITTTTTTTTTSSASTSAPTAATTTPTNLSRRERLRSHSRKSIQSSSDSSNLSFTAATDNEMIVVTENVDLTIAGNETVVEEGETFINNEEIFMDNINNVANVVEIADDFSQISNTLNNESNDDDDDDSCNDKQIITLDNKLVNYDTGSLALSSSSIDDSQSQSADSLLAQADDNSNNNIEEATTTTEEIVLSESQSLSIGSETVVVDSSIMPEDEDEVLLEISTDDQAVKINTNLYAFASPPHYINQNDDSSSNNKLNINVNTTKQSVCLNVIKINARNRDTYTPDRVVSSPETLQVRTNTKAPRTYQNRRKSKTATTLNEIEENVQGASTSSSVNTAAEKLNTPKSTPPLPQPKIKESQDKSNIIQGTPITTVTECRRSQRNRIIKYDVRDLLNKNRKSKIQIETKVVLKPKINETTFLSSTTTPTTMSTNKIKEGFVDTDRSNMLNSPQVSFKGFSDSSDNSKSSPITIKEKVCTPSRTAATAAAIEKINQKKEISIQTIENKNEKKEIGIQLTVTANEKLENILTGIMTKSNAPAQNALSKRSTGKIIAKEMSSKVLMDETVTEAAAPITSNEKKNNLEDVNNSNNSLGSVDEVIVINEEKQHEQQLQQQLPQSKTKNLKKILVTTTKPPRRGRKKKSEVIPVVDQIELSNDETSDENDVIQMYKKNAKQIRTQEIFMKNLKRSQRVESFIANQNINLEHLSGKRLYPNKIDSLKTSSTATAGLEQFSGEIINLVDDDTSNESENSTKGKDKLSKKVNKRQMKSNKNQLNISENINYLPPPISYGPNSERKKFKAIVVLSNDLKAHEKLIGESSKSIKKVDSKISKKIDDKEEKRVTNKSKVDIPKSSVGILQVEINDKPILTKLNELNENKSVQEQEESTAVAGISSGNDGSEDGVSYLIEILSNNPSSEKAAAAAATTTATTTTTTTTAKDELLTKESQINKNDHDIEKFDGNESVKDIETTVKEPIRRASNDRKLPKTRSSLRKSLINNDKILQLSLESGTNDNVTTVSITDSENACEKILNCSISSNQDDNVKIKDDKLTVEKSSPLDSLQKDFGQEKDNCDEVQKATEIEIVKICKSNENNENKKIEEVTITNENCTEEEINLTTNLYNEKSTPPKKRSYRRRFPKDDALVNFDSSPSVSKLQEGEKINTSKNSNYLEPEEKKSVEDDKILNKSELENVDKIIADENVTVTKSNVDFELQEEKTGDNDLNQSTIIVKTKSLLLKKDKKSAKEKEHDQSTEKLQTKNLEMQELLNVVLDDVNPTKNEIGENEKSITPIRTKRRKRSLEKFDLNEMKNKLRKVMPPCTEPENIGKSTDSTNDVEEEIMEIVVGNYSKATENVEEQNFEYQLNLEKFEIEKEKLQENIEANESVKSNQIILKECNNLLESYDQSKFVTSQIISTNFVKEMKQIGTGLDLKTDDKKDAEETSKQMQISDNEDLKKLDDSVLKKEESKVISVIEKINSDKDCETTEPEPPIITADEQLDSNKICRNDEPESTSEFIILNLKGTDKEQSQSESSIITPLTDSAGISTSEEKSAIPEFSMNKKEDSEASVKTKHENVSLEVKESENKSKIVSKSNKKRESIKSSKKLESKEVRTKSDSKISSESTEKSITTELNESTIKTNRKSFEFETTCKKDSEKSNAHKEKSEKSNKEKCSSKNVEIKSDLENHKHKRTSHIEEVNKYSKDSKKSCGVKESRKSSNSSENLSSQKLLERSDLNSSDPLKGSTNTESSTTTAMKQSKSSFTNDKNRNDGLFGKNTEHEKEKKTLKQSQAKKVEKDSNKIPSKEEKEKLLSFLYCPQKATPVTPVSTTSSTFEKDKDKEKSKKDRKMNKEISDKYESLSRKTDESKSNERKDQERKSCSKRDRRDTSLSEKTKMEGRKESHRKLSKDSNSNSRHFNSKNNKTKYEEKKDEHVLNTRDMHSSVKTDILEYDKDLSRNEEGKDLKEKKIEAVTSPPREKSDCFTITPDNNTDKSVLEKKLPQEEIKINDFDVKCKDSIQEVKMISNVNTLTDTDNSRGNFEAKFNEDIIKIIKYDFKQRDQKDNLSSINLRNIIINDDDNNTEDDNSETEIVGEKINIAEIYSSFWDNISSMKFNSDENSKDHTIRLGIDESSSKKKIIKTRKSRWDDVERRGNEEKKSNSDDDRSSMEYILSKNIDYLQQSNNDKETNMIEKNVNIEKDQDIMGTEKNEIDLNENENKSAEVKLEGLDNIKLDGFKNELSARIIPSVNIAKPTCPLISKAALKVYPSDLQQIIISETKDLESASNSSDSNSSSTLQSKDVKMEIENENPSPKENENDKIEESTMSTLNNEVQIENAEQEKTALPKEESSSQDSQDDSVNTNIRRSHRLKTISKTKLSVGRGLVRDKERFIDVAAADDKFQLCNSSAAELEAENAKFLKDMEDRLSQFQVIKENEYKCDRIISKEARKMTCDCFLTRDEEERGELGCGEDCLNRLLMIECGPKCVVSDRCTNKRFQKNLYAPCKVFRTEKKGFGIMADGEILPGEFIMEYVGEVLNDEQFRKRAQIYSEDKNKHYYFMALRSDAIIDATQKGNISRFINHSCDPNAETQKWTVNGELRIGFFSRRKIDPGEEVTFDYQFQRYGKEAQKCYCESANCRGWIGEEPDSEEEEEISSESEEEIYRSTDQEEKSDELILQKKQIENNEIISVPTTDNISVTTVPMPVPPPNIEKAEKDIQEALAKPSDTVSPTVVDQAPVERKKVKHKKEFRFSKKKVEYLEDHDIDEEIESLTITGLKNQSHTLRLSRLMVRAKLLVTRIRLLEILRSGEMPCKRLFLDYHGLRLLHGWINENETNDIEKVYELRLFIVQTLEILPIPNKTLLKESKVYQTIESWANEKEMQTSSPNDDSSPRDSGSAATPAAAATINDDQQQQIKTDQDSEIIHPMKAEIAAISKKLLLSWDELPEVFKIPKRERIEQMKEHEREADRQYKALNLIDEDNDRFNSRRRIERFGKRKKINPIINYTWTREGRKEVDKDLDRNDIINSSLTKFQRRQLFAAKVARDEQEKRWAEEWYNYENMCKFYGLDAYQTLPQDFPFCYNPATGHWYTIDGRQIQVPLSQMHYQAPYKQKSTDPNDYNLPPMDLPPQWKFAMDPNGRIYYYHVKIRIPQWELPIKIEPLAGKELQDSEENTTASGGTIKAPSTSSLEQSTSSNRRNSSSSSDSDDNVTESKIRKIDDTSSSVNDESKKSIKEKTKLLKEERKKERRNRLVEERPISPRREADRIYNQIEMRRYRENKEKIRKRREELKRKKAQMLKESGSTSSSALSPAVEATDGSTETGKPSEGGLPLPIQDYLFSSDEEEQLRSECNSPLIEKLVQGDKIVDELDALKRDKLLKRALPIKERRDSKKRQKLEEKERKKKEDSKEAKSQKSSKHSSKHSVRKSKEKFRCDIAGIIVQHLTPYRKETCQIGRITNNDDFKHLARKLTHFVMVKELKHCDSTGQKLEVTESVKNKSREFIKKYMAKYGEIYIRPENDPEFKDIPHSKD